MEAIEIIKQWKEENKKTNREVSVYLGVHESQLTRWLHGKFRISRLWSNVIIKKLKLTKVFKEESEKHQGGDH